jgi:hypothetical protein
MLETPLLLGLRRQIVDLAAKLRLSAVYNNREFVVAGGLLSYEQIVGSCTGARQNSSTRY